MKEIKRDLKIMKVNEKCYSDRKRLKMIESDRKRLEEFKRYWKRLKEFKRDWKRLKDDKYRIPD